MIRLKRIYDPASEEDGVRILVDRLWPRGIKKTDAKIDEWLKDIAPSAELRKWFSHDISKWQEFRARYLHELKSRPEIIKKLGTEAGNNNITLLFAAKNAEHNSAVVLKELLQQIFFLKPDYT